MGTFTKTRPERSENNMELFPELQTKPTEQKTCLTCQHRQRWQCNSKVFQYCGARKSNRTENGLLKIKCKTVACTIYKSCE